MVETFDVNGSSTLKTHGDPRPRPWKPGPSPPEGSRVLKPLGEGGAKWRAVREEERFPVTGLRVHLVRVKTVTDAGGQQRPALRERRQVPVSSEGNVAARSCGESRDRDEGTPRTGAEPPTETPRVPRSTSLACPGRCCYRGGHIVCWGGTWV